MKFSEKIYSKSPALIQNCLITLYSYVQHKKKYGGKYHEWKKYYQRYEFSTHSDLQLLQKNRFREFIEYVLTHSEYYQKKYQGIDLANISIDDLSSLPILLKEELRSHTQEISTLKNTDCYVSRTGGTTGKSLTVFYEWEDFQERMALLDLFRERFTTKERQKTAWFSGKDLLGEQKGTYWRTDYVSKIRYYSTFHINQNTIKNYIRDFNNYKPVVFVGFPSSLIEIAKYGLANSIILNYKPEALFPTAETVTKNDIEILSSFFNCGVYNQYASSEGAPFITECEKGGLHYEILSGLIEVIDENGGKANSGEILVTSFTTKGTPLIRYKIEDSITLKEGSCPCGRNTPLVQSINGRVNDFIYSTERGKINLGNISNCVKYTNGIIKFQIIQNDISKISVKLVTDPNCFTDKDEMMFVKELRARLGESIDIEILFVDKIDKEASGKYRLVKSTLTLP